jgi:hypothetical protein
MKTFALVLVSLSLIGAGAGGAHAQEQTSAPAQQQQSVQPAAKVASAEAPIGRDGQAASNYCSKENPFIEYRDCANAATRDPNAKVRMG